MFDPLRYPDAKSRQPRGRFWTLLSISILWWATAFYQSCQGPEPSEQPPREHPIARIQGEYLGDLNCRSCHAEEYDQWKGSHHDWAMADATDSTVLGDFSEVTFEANGVSNFFYRKGEEFWVRTQGINGEEQDHRILYTFGVEPLQQYLVGFPKGKLQALRVSWDSDQRRWFHQNPDLDISPREWLHWTRGSMNWNNMCATCHSTHLRENFDSNSDSYATTYSVLNVSCEACHGAGTQHVNYIESPSYGEGKKVAGSYMYLTKDIRSIQQVDLCGPCHSRRSRVSSDYRLEDHYMDHYLPQILREGLYHSDGQILDEVYVYGSFVQSKMYKNNVKCTDCHNAHTLKVKTLNNGLCLQCHEPEYNSQEHHFHPLTSEGASCINCHMPGKNYMVNDFRRDHSFRIPRPDQSLEYDTPNSCNGCHTDQTIQWAADAIRRWYGPRRAHHYSDVLNPAREDPAAQEEQLIRLLDDTAQAFIVRATAVEYLGRVGTEKSTSRIIQALEDPEPLVRSTALNQLAYVPLPYRIELFSPRLSDSIRAVRVAAANGLAEVPLDQMDSSFRLDYRKALNEYLVTLSVRSPFASGQLMLGQYLERSGQVPKAEKAYLKAVEIDSLFNPARVNLAGLYNRQGRNQEAIALYRTVLNLEPEYGYGYYSMGLLLAEENRMEEAVEFLEKAARIETSNSRIYYNWALALTQLRRLEEAEQAYLEGLEIEPESEPLMYALGVFYLQQNRPGEALVQVEKLLRLNPQVPDYLQLKQAVDQSLTQ